MSRPVVHTWLCALLALSAGTAAVESFAQPPQLAADIRTRQINFLPWNTGPHSFSPLGDHLYFAADDGLHGFELWRTDGTSAGTELVADVCPGHCNGILFGVGPTAGGLVYFRGDDGVHGTELWVSDGTADGTRMVRDIAPVLSSSPSWLTRLGDRVAFTAEDPENGRELWVSDGTEAGTVLLGDLVPGPEGSEPSALLATRGTLFFNAWDPAHGREPWASDGTPGGAVRLADVRPGSDDSVIPEVFFARLPLRAAVLDGLYVFVADDGVNSRQIWVSDGSPAGTTRVSDLSFDLGTGMTELTTVGSVVVFVARRTGSTGSDLWKTDGTPGGTERVTSTSVGLGFPRGLTAVGARIFYAYASAGRDVELWASDGTGAGTHQVADLWPGPEGSVEWTLWWTGGWELDSGRLLFFADDGTHGVEPWVSDGTAGGTFRLGDIATGEWSSHFAHFAPFSPPAPVAGGMAFFAWNEDLGYELWWSDGTRNGTRLVKDFDRQPSSLTDVARFPAADTAAVGGRLFFQALDDDHGIELWISGGTPGTTRLVKDIETIGRGEPISSLPFELVPVEDTVVFKAKANAPNTTAAGEVWRSDGSETGTYRLVAPGDGRGHGFSAVAGHAVFTGDKGFWVTDGSVAGTRLVTGVEQGIEATEVGGTVVFSGTAAATGQELYRLDAALTEANLVADLVPGPDSSRPLGLARLGDLLLFSATTPAAGREPWVSDGTEANTRMLADLRPGARGSMLETSARTAYGGVELPPIVASGPRAYLGADDGIHGMELWVSDGTAAGTTLVADIRPGPRGSNPAWLTDVSGRLYFVAEDGSSGVELWTSDGTAAGTRLVADLAPGAASSSPRFLLDVDGSLHFAAFTPSHGVELWRLDASGTPERVSDLLPGPGSSSPSYLSVAGRRLFFFANDGASGFEPWSLVLPSRKLRAALSGRREGTAVFLTLVLDNPTPVDQPDADGDELVLPLPAGLTPVAVEATSGRVEVVGASGAPVRRARAAGAATAGHTLLWNGELPAGANVTISVELTLAAASSAPVQLQAELFFDTDTDGANDLSVLSDDPLAPGEADPTVILAPAVVEVPALGPTGALILALALALAAGLRVRWGVKFGRPR